MRAAWAEVEQQRARAAAEDAAARAAWAARVEAAREAGRGFERRARAAEDEAKMLRAYLATLPVPGVEAPPTPVGKARTPARADAGRRAAAR